MGKTAADSSHRFSRLFIIGTIMSSSRWLTMGLFARRSFGSWGVILPLVILLLGGLVAGWHSFSLPSASEDNDDFFGQFHGGTLFIVGGGEMPSDVRQRFWKLAGGRDAHLVIIPAYDAHPTDLKNLKGEWKGFRFASMKVLQAKSREEADGEAFSLPIQRATAIWFSGGEQSWLANLYSETKVENHLQQLLDRGGIIGGTSAGAAIMTRVMIEEGNRVPKIRRGLDLFKDSVVDQHFLHRNRMQRLVRTLRDQPHLIGFGIDESTALVVRLSHRRLGVVGKSYVTACIPDPNSDNVRIEILKQGDYLDLDGLREIETPEREVAL